MNIDYLNKFKKAKNLGLKAKAKSNIRMFIDSFTNDEEKSHWVKTYLEKGDYGHKIRHELYEEIVFPVLLNGYHINDSWSLYWLAKTIKNLYQSEKLHCQIDFKTDSELLRACFSSDQTNHSVRLALLSRIVNSLDYAVHEWPAGVCYAPKESSEDLLKEIDYARSLDMERNYSEFFAKVEAIVNEDKARMA